MAKMRAVQVVRAGGPLELVERDAPEPARGEVRVRIGEVGPLPFDRETVAVANTAGLAIVASSSMERTVGLASLGPVGEIAGGLTLLPLRDSLLVDPVALSEGFMGLVIVRVASLCNPSALNAEFWMNASPNTRRVRNGSN